MEIIKDTVKVLILGKKANINIISFRIFRAYIYGFFYVLLSPYIAIVLWKVLSLWGVTELNCERVETTILNCQCTKTKVGGFIREKKVLNNVQEDQYLSILIMIFRFQIDEKILRGKNGQDFTIEQLVSIKLGNDYFLALTPKTTINFYPGNSFRYLIDSRTEPGVLFLVGFYSFILIISTALFCNFILNIKLYSLWIKIDQANKNIYLEQLSLFGLEKKNYSFDQVSTIAIEPSQENENNYTLVLLINGKKYILDSTKDFNALKNNREKICNFLEI